MNFQVAKENLPVGDFHLFSQLFDSFAFVKSGQFSESKFATITSATYIFTDKAFGQLVAIINLHEEVDREIHVVRKQAALWCSAVDACRNTRPRPSIFRRPTHLYKPARPWACRVCGYILGTFHLAFGVGLLILDLATNWITETVFAITAGICFVVTGIASLIATKRLDKGTITILLLFSIVSLILSLIIVIESSTSINYLCHKGSCAEHEATVRACLLIVCLMEMVNAVLSCFISVRSLLDCADADLIKPISPVGIFLTGQEKPPLKNLISSEQVHALITASRK
ncbi:hypothetical protein T4E_10182 [Trichinella pseudospiralis]|uniref:Uncharacterized protein n=1 Tax=Trichinella pseudospiralis TaxID=6337 RepID=A0A0V0YAZ5_TRIPS|nr:hypothetical protein T4E_10182 [Trichinella pseudospiralis]